MKIFLIILTGYLFIINIIGFALMGIDKKRAVRGAWRISEASLFLTALLGGALGCTLGMRHFRHKTRHWYFKYGMPAIFAAQAFRTVPLARPELIPAGCRQPESSRLGGDDDPAIVGVHAADAPGVHDDAVPEAHLLQNHALYLLRPSRRVAVGDDQPPSRRTLYLRGR